MIVAAAIRHKPTGIVLTLPRPNRHLHINMVAKDHLRIERNVVNLQCEEGFLSDTGAFLGRVDAMLHARAVGQLLKRRQPGDPAGAPGRASSQPELFSEDLW